MGEYAIRKSDGSNIKIGTMEDMYYLRADQIGRIQGQRGSVDPSDRKTAEKLRFRFPFPWEDDIAPGDFADHNFGLSVHGADLPEEIDHYPIQFANSRGLLVSLPCPEGKEGKASGLKFHYNGYGGKVRIVQQKLVGDRLVLICECGSCGAKYRLPELTDAADIIARLNEEADAADKRATEGGAALRAIVQRIVDGYTKPNYWSV